MYPERNDRDGAGVLNQQFCSKNELTHGKKR